MIILKVGVIVFALVILARLQFYIHRIAQTELDPTSKGIATLTSLVLVLFIAFQALSLIHTYVGPLPTFGLMEGPRATYAPSRPKTTPVDPEIRSPPSPRVVEEAVEEHQRKLEAWEK